MSPGAAERRWDGACKRKVSHAGSQPSELKKQRRRRSTRAGAGQQTEVGWELVEILLTASSLSLM